MDFYPFIRRLAAARGTPGGEANVAQIIKEAFAPYCTSVEVDALYNVVARVGKGSPKLLVTAHQDEIGLVVTNIEKDGSLRVEKVGGVDPRILPAAEVTVLTASGPLPGVVGAKPPHLLSEADRKKTIQFKDIHVDVGLSPEKALQTVRPGDPAYLTGETVQLKNRRMAGKTMDDRACVAAMVAAAEQLSRHPAPCEVIFVAASQEEIGGYGVKTATYAAEPDAAVVIDVTHAETPGAPKFRTFPIDKITLTTGPNIAPALYKMAEQTAKTHHVEYTVEPCGHVTWTDADETQISRAGVPTLLIGVPLKYMHTTVELLEEDVRAETGRFVARFADDLARGWEEMAWY